MKLLSAGLAIVLPWLCLPLSARALDSTSPRLRLGVSAGVLGSLPLGRDVSSGAGGDEFTRALWVQVEPLQLELGAHLQLSALIRVAALGGYNERLLGAALEAEHMASRPRARLSLLGLGARVFPFGDSLVRPFLALALGYAAVGARYSALSQEAIDSMDQGGMGGSPPGAFGGSAACGPGVCVENTRRHRGLGISVGAGVRLDPTVQLFGEPWVLPLLLEVSYTAHAFRTLDHDLSYEGAGAAQLSGAKPRVGFLGALCTFGFLR